CYSIMLRSSFVSFVVCIFFFSSRRRHTRSKRDWSSDVCSSDLLLQSNQIVLIKNLRRHLLVTQTFLFLLQYLHLLLQYQVLLLRSEERRVGKECRSRCVLD